eukprot:6172174-Pleurochrysis_carterae.AAC.1
MSKKNAKRRHKARKTKRTFVTNHRTPSVQVSSILVEEAHSKIGELGLKLAALRVEQFHCAHECRRRVQSVLICPARPRAPTPCQLPDLALTTSRCGSQRASHSQQAAAALKGHRPNNRPLWLSKGIALTTGRCGPQRASHSQQAAAALKGRALREAEVDRVGVYVANAAHVDRAVDGSERRRGSLQGFLGRSQQYTCRAKTLSKLEQFVDP